MGKISYGQMAVTFFVTRLFSEMVEISTDAVRYGADRFWIILFAKLIVFVAYLPIIFITIRFENENFMMATVRRSKTVGWIFAVIFIFSVTIEIITSLINIEHYINDTILGNVAYGVIVIPILAAALYGMGKGIESISRTAIAVGGIFVLLLIVVIIVQIPNYNFVYLYPAIFEDSGSFMSMMIAEFANSSEILIFAIICCCVRNSPKKVVFYYIPLILVVLELTNLIYNLVLGPYLTTVEYPFFIISSLTDIVVFQRLDGIDAIVWIMGCIIKLALLMLVSREAIGYLIGGTGKKIFIYSYGAVIGIGTILLGINLTLAEYIRDPLFSSISILVSGCFLPLLGLFIGKKKT